jgi:hypothetical protein
MSEQESMPRRSRYHVTIDTRDVMGIVGAAVVLIGSASINYGLASIVAGVALCALAYRLSR